jgi:basic amino acid/polyamine antiporter, APA family
MSDHAVLTDIKHPQPPVLVRAIGRWSLAALTINAIIGSSIFGLPSVIAQLLGPVSPLAVLVAGLMICVIVLCYAEVGSQFTSNGGTYLYIHDAFGKFAGLQAAWFTLLSAFSARAAAVNLFVTYLAEFWPPAARTLPRLTLMTALIAVLTAVNLRGVKSGTRVNNLLLLCKLFPVVVVMFGGMYWVSTHLVSTPATTNPGHWMQAILVLFFAYGGFETALAPMGEARDPRRDVPFALFLALAVVALIYFVIQWLSMNLLPNAAQSSRPIAELAGVLFGPVGSAMITVCALFSILGYLNAGMLASPRYTFALAEQGDFPAVFAAIHPRFQTPHVSILFFAFLIWPLALLGSFSWNVTLSAVAKLFYYGMVCAALPRLRRKQPSAASFRVPGGRLLAVIGVLICLALLGGVDLSKSFLIVICFLAALLNWFLVKRNARLSPA